MKTLKSLFFAAAGLLLLASCQTEKIDSQQDNRKETCELTIRILDENATKNYLDTTGTSGAVLWHSGNQIGYYSPNSSITGVGNHSEVSVNGNTPTFRIKFDKNIDEGGYIYAYYPYWDRFGIFLKYISSEQYYNPKYNQDIPVVSEPIQVPSVLPAGTETELDVHFVNLSTVLRFNVTTVDPDIQKETVERIVVSSNETMSGWALMNALPTLYNSDMLDSEKEEMYKLHFLNGDVELFKAYWGNHDTDGVIDDIVGNNYITCWNDDNLYGALSGDQVYDIIAAPGTYTNVTVVVFTDKATYTFSVPDKGYGREFKRNVVNRFNLTLKNDEKRKEFDTHTIWMAADTVFAITVNNKETGKVVLPEGKPSAKGYTFAGWTLDADSLYRKEGALFADNNTKVSDKDSIYHAVFSYNGVMVHFDEPSGEIWGFSARNAIDAKDTTYISNLNRRELFDVTLTKSYKYNGDLFVKGITYTPRDGVTIESVSFTQEGTASVVWCNGGYNSSDTIKESQLPLQVVAKSDKEGKLKGGEFTIKISDESLFFQPYYLNINYKDTKSYVIL